jgi:hypothetical protein
VPRIEIDVHHQTHRYELALERVKADVELLPAHRQSLLEFNSDPMARGITTRLATPLNTGKTHAANQRSLGQPILRNVVYSDQTHSDTDGRRRPDTHFHAGLKATASYWFSLTNSRF